jgi:hypothetical protein
MQVVIRSAALEASGGRQVQASKLGCMWRSQTIEVIATNNHLLPLKH